ncbi:MAG: hypothetical protein Gaeavirus4_4 [Gaeavirus sp.]|uniref:Uncharacterized protein n=1 Tax=Gaeavirus sp. TaxID=2487767 RepID=A0A3G5A1C0_9VIRU|nr:MAG: hypothetical protein Gaeavirus4_4 [Gaeavirus sp.]
MVLNVIVNVNMDNTTPENEHIATCKCCCSCNIIQYLCYKCKAAFCDNNYTQDIIRKICVTILIVIAYSLPVAQIVIGILGISTVINCDTNLIPIQTWLIIEGFAMILIITGIITLIVGKTKNDNAIFLVNNFYVPFVMCYFFNLTWLIVGSVVFKNDCIHVGPMYVNIIMWISLIAGYVTVVIGYYSCKFYINRDGGHCYCNIDSTALGNVYRSTCKIVQYICCCCPCKFVQYICKNRAYDDLAMDTLFVIAYCLPLVQIVIGFLGISTVNCDTNIIPIQTWLIIEGFTMIIVITHLAITLAGYGNIVYLLCYIFNFTWLIVGCVVFKNDCIHVGPIYVNAIMWISLIAGYIISLIASYMQLFDHCNR